MGKKKEMEKKSEKDNQEEEVDGRSCLLELSSTRVCLSVSFLLSFSSSLPVLLLSTRILLRQD